MKSLRTTALLSLLLAAAPAWAVKPFTADYEASVMGGISADAQMTLASAGGDRWNYVLSVDSPVATLRQSTVFEARGGAWRPLSGNDSTQMLIKKSQKNASYDWAKGEARWSGDVKADRAGPVKLQDGDLDAMLLNLAIVRDVAAGKPLNLLRLAKASTTFDGAATYAAWKIERHTGVAIEVTPWRERHPLLAAPGVLWRVWRARHADPR